MDTAVAETTPCLSKINDGSTDLRILRCSLRRMAVTVSGEPHKATGVAFGKAVFIDGLPNGQTLHLWG